MATVYNDTTKGNGAFLRKDTVNRLRMSIHARKGRILSCILILVFLTYATMASVPWIPALIFYGFVTFVMIRYLNNHWDGERNKNIHQIKRRTKIMVTAFTLIIFCNLTPIAIDSLWNPYIESFTLSDDYTNERLDLNNVKLNTLGQAGFLFLQKTSDRTVVCTENGWIKGYYNGESIWGRSFSANGSGYIIVNIAGITGFNISLVYPDYERVNYTVSLGENQFPAYFGAQPIEYAIQVGSRYQQYITMLTIQPLYVQFWENITLDYSEDTNCDNRITKMDANPHIFEKEFFAHGEITVYIYQPGISYNALYIQIDDIVIQNLHPISNVQGNNEFISSDIVAEYTNKGHALRYDIDLDNMFKHSSSFTNHSWNGWHTLKIAICGAYMDQIPGIGEIEFEYAILSYVNNDFDGDLLTTDEEVNIHYDQALSPEFSDTWAYWNVIPEADMKPVFKSNWSAAMLTINYRSLIDGYLYIDICSNESGYRNFTINDQAVWNGSQLGNDIRFLQDGWWSLLTDTVMEYGNTYQVSFLYDTSSKLPKESLLFIVNHELIPILEVGDTKRLSDELIDSDEDGIVDVLDDSRESSLILDSDEIWRLITDVKPESDTEIHFQIKPSSEDLYALTHNSSVYYEWNNESIVSITPALRLYSDVITQDTYESVDYSYKGKNLKLNTQYQDSVAYPEVRRLSLDEFLRYWNDYEVEELVYNKFHPVEYTESFICNSQSLHLKFGCVPNSLSAITSLAGMRGDEIDLVEGTDFNLIDTNNDDILDTITLMRDYRNLRNCRVYYEIDYGEAEVQFDNTTIINALSDPTAIDSYQTDEFGDNPPRFFNGIPYTSEYDGIVDTSIKSWFRYYVDNIAEEGYDGYYFDEDTIRYYYQVFVDSLTGSLEDHLIDLTADENTFEGSVFVPANHESKQDLKLDLLMGLNWKITDLNVFGTIAYDYSDAGYFDLSNLLSEYRKVTDVYEFNATSQKMILRTLTYMRQGFGDFYLSATEYDTVYFANQSLWIPDYGEIMNLMRGNQYASYIQWKDYAEYVTQTNFDENLLDSRFGIYNKMEDITGKILPPGAKVYNHGTPKFMHLYPWNKDEDVTIQSIKIIEHEKVDYMLCSPENVGENVIFESLIKNKNLWNLNADIFNQNLGGISISDDIYGEDSIKTTTQLDLMTKAFIDYETETNFGTGWGIKEFPLDTIQLPGGYAKIDDIFNVNGTYQYLKKSCYNYRENLMQFGEILHTYNGSMFTSFSNGPETHEYINGSISLDVAGIQGEFALKLYDKLNRCGLNLGFDLSLSPNWLIYTISGHENTGVTVSEEFQTIEISWTGANQRMILAIDGQVVEFQHLPYVPLLNGVKNISSIVIDMHEFIGYFDEFTIPAWTQVGSQTKVLYTNAVYSTRDLCKTIVYNLNYGKFIGNFFEYNGTSFYLRYSPDRFVYDMLYADSKAQFIDYVDTSLDTVTFDFNQAFLEGQQHPYFTSTANNALLYEFYNDNEGLYIIYDDTSADIIPFKNGFVSGNFRNASDIYDESYSFDIFKLGYFNRTTFKPMNKAITLGVVDGKFGMQLPGEEWSLSTMDCSAGITYWYRLGISNTTGIWVTNLTIFNGTSYQSIVENLNIAESEMFGSLNYITEEQLFIDNITVSSMINVYQAHNYPAYSSFYNSESIYSTYFMDNVSYAIEESLIIKNNIVDREFEAPVRSGMLRFNIGVPESQSNFVISLLDQSTYGMDLLVINGEVSIRMNGATDTIYENDVTIETDSFSTITFIFGVTSVIAGHSTPALSLLWNNIFVGTYAFKDAYPNEHLFTGIEFNTLSNYPLLLNSLSLSDIADIPCSNYDFNFNFGGYWYEDMPNSFIFNNQSFSQEITWTGEYVLPNGTVFAYVDDFGLGQVADNYTDAIHWRNITWGKNYVIPIAQYWNGTSWVDGEINADRLWCNVTGVNVNKFYDTIEIGNYGSKLLRLTSTNLIINEYTPIADQLLDNLNGVDSLSPFNLSYNVEILLSDLIIYRRKNGGSGYDRISDITATSYNINGTLMQGNICTSEFATLPYGSKIILRCDGNDIAEPFHSLIESYTVVPDVVSFDWRYLHNETSSTFESMQLASNVTNLEEFASLSSKSDYALLWWMNIMRDYNYNLHGSVPIQNLHPGNYPTDIHILNYQIVNASSRTNILISNITISSVVFNPYCQSAHIPSNISEIAESPFILIVDTTYCYIYIPISTDLWQLENLAITNQHVGNQWRQIPIGNLLFQAGSPSIRDLIVLFLTHAGRAKDQIEDIADSIMGQIYLLQRFTLIDHAMYVASTKGIYYFDHVHKDGSLAYKKLYYAVKTKQVKTSYIDRWDIANDRVVLYYDDGSHRHSIYNKKSTLKISVLNTDLGDLPLTGKITKWSDLAILDGFVASADGFYDKLFYYTAPTKFISECMPNFDVGGTRGVFQIRFIVAKRKGIFGMHHVIQGAAIAIQFYNIFDCTAATDVSDGKYRNLARIINAFLYQTGLLVDLPDDLHDLLENYFSQDKKLHGFNDFVNSPQYSEFCSRLTYDLDTNDSPNHAKIQKMLFFIDHEEDLKLQTLLRNKNNWNKYSSSNLDDLKCKRIIRLMKSNDVVFAFLTTGEIDPDAEFRRYTGSGKGQGFKTFTFRELFIQEGSDGKLHFHIQITKNWNLMSNTPLEEYSIKDEITGKIKTMYRLGAPNINAFHEGFKDSLTIHHGLIASTLVDLDSMMEVHNTEIGGVQGSYLIEGENCPVDRIYAATLYNRDDIFRVYLMEGLIQQKLMETIDPELKFNRIQDIEFKNTYLKIMALEYSNMVDQIIPADGKVNMDALKKMQEFHTNLVHRPTTEVGKSGAIASAPDKSSSTSSGTSIASIPPKEPGTGDMPEKVKEMKHTTLIKKMSNERGKILHGSTNLKHLENLFYTAQKEFSKDFNKALKGFGVDCNIGGDQIQSLSISQKANLLSQMQALQDADELAGGYLLIQSPKNALQTAQMKRLLMLNVMNDEGIEQLQSMMHNVNSYLKKPEVIQKLSDLKLAGTAWSKCMGRAFLKEWFKNSIVEIVMFLWQWSQLRNLQENGVISQKEYTRQFWTQVFWSALDIGLEGLAALRAFGLQSAIWSKIAAVAGVIGLIITIIQVGYMFYQMITMPAIGSINGFSMNSPKHMPQKFGSYRINDTVSITEMYGNYEFPMPRTHFLRLSARTSRMPMNLTHPERPHYECNLSYDPYEYRFLFLQHPEWAFEYTEGEPAIEDWYSTRVDTWAWIDWTSNIALDVPLKNLTRGEVITTHQIYGTVTKLVADDVEFWNEFEIGAVVEISLGDFVNNMKPSTLDTSDVDFDGINQLNEVQNGTNCRLSDSDSDKINDLDEITIYHTNPTEYDTDNDGLSDYDELITYGTNPLVGDTDFDGLNDYLETRFYTNPNIGDSDSDGLNDAYEYNHNTFGNLSDSDFDSLSDLTEQRLDFNPRDPNSPNLKMAQGAFQTSPIGFYQGTNSFNMKPIGSDPWFTNAMTGNAYISESYGTPIHNFVYLFNGSSVRSTPTDLMMSENWQIESYVSFTNKATFKMQAMVSNGYYFGLQYNKVTAKLEYCYNMKDWKSFTNIISFSDIQNWSVWSINWDSIKKQLTLSVDLNSDKVIDHMKILNSSNCPLLGRSFGAAELNRVMFENIGYGICAIDSVSMWTQAKEWSTGYKIGNLYSLIKFPDIFTNVNRDTASITFEWAGIEDMKMGIYYDDEDFVDIHSQNIKYAGPFESTATIYFDSDGKYYFKPCAIFQNYFFPLGTTITEKLTCYKATFDFNNDSIGQAPKSFTTYGNTSVEQTRDVKAWYSNDPYSNLYQYVCINDTSSNSASSMEKIVTRFIQNDDFIEFWWKANNSNLESKFSLIDMDNTERIALRIKEGYFWLTSGSYKYNTTIEVFADTWYHMRLTLSQSNWSELFINSEFVDNFKVDMNYDLQLFRFATVNVAGQYTLSVKGVGISWYGYQAYENWPELAEINMQEETTGFGYDSDKPSFITVENHLIATNKVFTDFLFLSDTAILTNTGDIYDISGSETHWKTRIYKWSSAQIFEGKLYIMSEETGHIGLCIYNINDQLHPIRLGEPLQRDGTHYNPPYGPAFDIIRIDYDHFGVRQTEVWAIISIEPTHYYDLWTQIPENDYWIFAYAVDQPSKINNTDLYYGKPIVGIEYGLNNMNQYENRLLQGVQDIYIDDRLNIYVLSSTWDPADYSEHYYGISVFPTHAHPNTGILQWHYAGPESVNTAHLDDTYAHNPTIQGQFVVQDDIIYVGLKNVTRPWENEMMYLVDASNDFLTFEISKGVGGYNFAFNEAMNQTIVYTKGGIDAYNYSHLISPDPNQVQSIDLSNQVAGVIHYYDDHLYSLETSTMPSGYIRSDLKRYESGYNFEISNWKNTSNIIIDTSHDGRTNAVLLQSGDSIAKDIAMTFIGDISFKMNIDTNTNGSIHLQTEGLDNKKQDIVFKIANSKINTDSANLPLHNGWNSVTISYASDLKTRDSSGYISVNGDSASFELPASTIPTEMNFTCGNDEVMIDAFQHRIIDTDTDVDNLNDLDEILRWKTDANSMDTDFDGMPDGWEVEYKLDPKNSNDQYYDNDRDGLSSADEFLYQTNPNDWDTDRDGESDGSEIVCGKDPLYPFDGDNDNDKVPNAIEVLFHTNINDNDTDSDGLNDYLELLSIEKGGYATNPANNDTDGDLMGDGYEAECGLNPRSAEDKDLDKDADHISNVQEWLGSSYSGWKRTNAGSNIDTLNHNNLPDDWEIYYNIFTNTTDTDSDKVTEIREFTAGTNPQVCDINETLGFSRDWATYYKIEYTARGASSDYDSDYVTAAQEYVGRYDSTNYPSTDPTSAGMWSWGMGRDWSIYWDIPRTYLSSLNDLDGDKIVNYMEYQGKWNNLNNSNFLSPRHCDKFERFTYKYPNGTIISGIWLSDWKIYWDVINSNGYTDTDHDGILDWQEMYGKWNRNTTVGLNPSENLQFRYGFNEHWATYWDIEFSQRGADADADSDGVKNGDEYTAGSNPRMADTDNDSLPDKYEIKWGLDPKDPEGQNGKDGNPDLDGLTNGEEYRFDIVTLKMNPNYWDSDRDQQSDKKEYLLYWQYNVGTGIRHNDSTRVSPIVKNTNPIISSMSDVATGWYSLCFANTEGDATYLNGAGNPYPDPYIFGAVFTSSIGWQTLDIWWNGYTMPYYLNSTITNEISSARIYYRVRTYSTYGGNALSEFKMVYTANGLDDEAYIFHSGDLHVDEINVWTSNSIGTSLYKEASSKVLNEVKKGNAIEKVRFYMTVGAAFPFQEGMIVVDYIGMEYRWS
jgi:hypothetical protein